jgi:hypothetical protein
LGDRQFKKDWQVPADTSGNGFWIGIVTSVYSDAGHTTRASGYGDEFETYLVFDRKNPYLGSGGGGGTEIDYKKIDKMIKNHIDNIEIPIIPEQKEVDLSGVYNSLEYLKNLIYDIKIPKPEKLDLSKVLTSIEEIKTLVTEIEIPEPEKLDLAPVITAITDNTDSIHNKIEEATVTIDQSLSGAIKELSKELSYENQMIKNINDIIDRSDDMFKDGLMNKKSTNKNRPFLKI